MDAFSGQSRPANTLSGGETFGVDGSCSLGLARIHSKVMQVVFHMDTMFIDEGFGTLDPDTFRTCHMEHWYNYNLLDASSALILMYLN